MTTENPKCPECKNNLKKAGMGWSGKNRTQIWRCTNPKCSRYGTRSTKH